MATPTPQQTEINRARFNAALDQRVEQMRTMAAELRVQLSNAERHPSDPMHSARVPALRERLAEAEGALAAQEQHRERLTRGVNPAGTWPPATAIAAGEAVPEKRGRGRGRPPGSRSKAAAQS